MIERATLWHARLGDRADVRDGLAKGVRRSRQFALNDLRPVSVRDGSRARGRKLDLRRGLVRGNSISKVRNAALVATLASGRRRPNWEIVDPVFQLARGAVLVGVYHCGWIRCRGGRARERRCRPARGFRVFETTAVLRRCFAQSAPLAVVKIMKYRQVTRRVESLVILRESKLDPSDEEWDETLRILVEQWQELHQLKVLVVSDGGGPTQAQRKRLERTLEGKPIRVAVVSDSMKVRFICSSVALFTSNLSSFKVSEMRDAYLWLNLSDREKKLAGEAVARMGELIG